VLGLIISAIIVGLIIGRWADWCSPVASALGVGETRGIDWIKLIIQVALAAAGVALVVGRYTPGRRGPVAQAAANRAGIQPHRSTSQARIMPRTQGPMRPGLA
jgi:hypothetical protein